MTNSATNHLLIDGDSRDWRRRLGPLPWAVLEELALIALPTEHGWSAPVGVRDLGAALAITKNTAARAIAALRSAGIVRPARVAREGGPPRPGYVLYLPDGVTLGKPPPSDGNPVPHESTRRRSGQSHDDVSEQPTLFTEGDSPVLPMRRANGFEEVQR
jgi:hypothetical protein